MQGTLERERVRGWGDVNQNVTTLMVGEYKLGSCLNKHHDRLGKYLLFGILSLIRILVPIMMFHYVVNLGRYCLYKGFNVFLETNQKLIFTISFESCRSCELSRTS